MSTRGFIAFAVDGETRVAYSHHDSYPDWLGIRVLTYARLMDIEQATAAARNLRVVTDADEPTDEDVERLAPYTNLAVGEPFERPAWYQLLRETQGSPGAMLDAGVIEDASGFPADSLFAEWGYVLDFDAQVFEVYTGFQRSPHTEGRFAGMDDADSSEGYYPVRLVKSWPLSDLPSDGAFIATVDPSDETEGVA